jgi:hypothetical protein
MKLLIVVTVLLLTSSVIGESQESSVLDSAKDFLSNVNPLILIVGGLIIFFASNLAKLIGIILVLVGIAGLILTII